MCDCAEEFERRKKAKAQNLAKAEKAAEASRPSPPVSTNRTILAMAAMLAGLLALLFGTLDRRTTHKILSFFGLGWLVPIETSQCPSKPKPPKCVPECPRQVPQPGKCTCAKKSG